MLRNSDAVGIVAEDAAAAVTSTLAAWERLRGARIFVTGGTGFVGTWLLETFAAAYVRCNLDAEIVVLTRDAQAFRQKAPHLANQPWIAFVSGDVRNFAFPPGNFTHVVHAATAASAALNANRPAEMLDTIVDGTRRVLKFVQRRSTARVLLVSSGAVYGRQPSELTHVPEEYGGGPDPLDPGQAYAEGKRVSELSGAIAALADDGPTISIARCFAFVGPYLPLDAHFAIGNFIRDALAGGPVNLSGDGTPFRSYLYAADLAAWLWTILSRGANARAYNVGSARGLQLWDIAHLVASNCGGCEVSRGRDPQPGIAALRYVPDVSRARQELGLAEWTPLETAIQRTVRWHSGLRSDAAGMTGVPFRP